MATSYDLTLREVQGGGGGAGAGGRGGGGRGGRGASSARRVFRAAGHTLEQRHGPLQRGAVFRRQSAKRVRERGDAAGASFLQQLGSACRSADADEASIGGIRFAHHQTVRLECCDELRDG